MAGQCVQAGLQRSNGTTALAELPTTNSSCMLSPILVSAWLPGIWLLRLHSLLAACALQRARTGLLVVLVWW